MATKKFYGYRQDHIVTTILQMLAAGKENTVYYTRRENGDVLKLEVERLKHMTSPNPQTLIHVPNHYISLISTYINKFISTY